MSTESATGFEWSVKLIGCAHFYAGVASKLEPDIHIHTLDANSILFCSNRSSPVIQVGTEAVHSNLTEQESGDVIHFQFQPRKKKLIIELV